MGCLLLTAGLILVCSAGNLVSTVRNEAAGGQPQSTLSIGRRAGQLVSDYAVLVDAQSGSVLYEKGADTQTAPASLTKMMTVLVALETIEDLDREVVLPQQIFDELEGQDASVAGFQAGERVRVEDLVYGALLPSGADAALGLAVAAAGSEEQMVELMNQRARSLGMHNTHFENVTGLTQEGHQSTAEDLAILLQQALKNDRFRQAMSHAQYTVESTNRHPRGFTFSSTLFEQLSEVAPDDQAILGGKTGYTDEAGLCLASFGQVDGREYVLVTLHAQGDHHTPPYHILDAVYIFDNVLHAS